MHFQAQVVAPLLKMEIASAQLASVEDYLMKMMHAVKQVRQLFKQKK
jgi:hypothetical protein